MNVLKNINEMFSARGYTSLEPDNPEQIVHDTNGTRILVYNNLVAKINISYIKSVLVSLKEHGINHAILVYESGITSSVSTVVNTALDYRIEFFEKTFFAMNITKHELVPVHSKITSQHHRYNWCQKESKNLPVLMRTDPIARFYLFLPGDIIEIGGGTKYRLVV